jgi:ABC-type Fe3+-hydroxamate transport system substrate-binding protein
MRAKKTKQVNKLLAALLLVFLVAFTACAIGNVSDAESFKDGEFKDAEIASSYAVAVPFIAALRLSDQVVAINCKSNFWTDNIPALGEAGTVGRGNVDFEALAKSGATVLIHRKNDTKTVASVENLGIEVVEIYAEDISDIKSTLSELGRLFGREERASEVNTWIDDKFELIAGVVGEIPADERKTALVMGSELGRIAGSDMLQAVMVEKAGGIYTSQEADKGKWLTVGAEKIFTQNPDVIFCTSSTPLDYSPTGLTEDSAWGTLPAIDNGNVYQIPAKIDSWDLPGVSCAIGTMYMLHSMYPERFSAESLQREIDEYYMLMFGRTFDSEYLGYDIIEDEGGAKADAN